MGNNIFDVINILLEDSNEDDFALDADDDVSADTTSDDTNNQSEEGSDDQQQDDTSEENNNAEEDNTGEEDQSTDDNTVEDDDLSIDDDENTEDGGEEGTDDSMSDDSSGEDSMGGEGEIDENDPNAKLKELEKSIFDQLSDEQKTLKTKELKSLFNTVYNKCTDIVSNISSAERSPEQAKIYDYVMNSLTDLQKYIKDYLFQIFDSKTYIENMVQLQKYLTVLDTVSNIFEEVKNSSMQENPPK